MENSNIIAIKYDKIRLIYHIYDFHMTPNEIICKKHKQNQLGFCFWKTFQIFCPESKKRLILLAYNVPKLLDRL